MAVILALCSALCYGLSDFVGGLVARRTSAWAVAVVAACSSTACTAAVATLVPGEPTGSDYGWAVVAGIGSGLGTGFLYRGLATGRMSVVAPVSAVGAAVLPVLAGVLTGERPSLVVWLGILAAFPGIWLVSSAEPGSNPAVRSADRASPGTPPSLTKRGRLPAGLVDAILAGVGFGVLFAALAQIPSDAGLWPLALAQAVSLPAVIGLAVALGGHWVPRGRPVRWALVAGPLGAAATATFLLATQQGYLTVAAVLTSLYPASTVMLAALLLREHVHRLQGIGLVLCGLAVALVAAG